MLGSLLGSVNKERALVFIASRGKGYAREIARQFAAPLHPLQRALDNLESAGVLVSRSVGSTREYEFNPRYAARVELLALIDRAMSFYAPPLRESLLMNRARPRRRRKPL